VLEESTIFLCLAGSHAHGTAGHGSDIDLRGVCVAPLSVRCSLFQQFEQTESALPDALWQRVLPVLQQHASASRGLGKQVESVVFDVAKFLRLCASANPNALEILFADEQDWLFKTEVWATIHAQRHRFLTQMVHQTYVGYAAAQLRRIESHRGWLLNPPKAKPSRAEFGLPEVGTFNRDDQKRLEGATGGLPPEVIRTLAAEKSYRGAMKYWESYLSWEKNRNPARAELERKFGYDTKHAAHLIRLMRCGLEVLQTGTLIVRRPDADELVAIKQGSWSYDRLIDESEALTADLAVAFATTSLPEDVDRSWVDELALSAIIRS
jgi:predicted nucleotidyltransferase